jgi:single-stranded-DNA-specific exonuclease
LEYSLISPRN